MGGARVIAKKQRRGRLRLIYALFGGKSLDIRVESALTVLLSPSRRVSESRGQGLIIQIALSKHMDIFFSGESSEGLYSVPQFREFQSSGVKFRRDYRDVSRAKLETALKAPLWEKGIKAFIYASLERSFLVHHRR